MHIASDLVGYAGQLTAPRQHGYVPFDVVLDGEPDAPELAEVVRATGGILAAVCETSSPDVLGHLFPHVEAADAVADAAEVLPVATGRLPEANGVLRTSWRRHNQGR